MVIPLRIWLAGAGRPIRQKAGGWSDADVARRRDGLKRGESLADLVLSLARSPAARICEFRPVTRVPRSDRGRSFRRRAQV